MVGITNAKYSGSSSSEASIDNIGFAIPIDSVRAIMESIAEKGYYAKPYIGVSVQDVTEAESQKYGLPAGAVVVKVVSGAPADQAGLKGNDVITAINGTEISGVNDLKRVLSRSQVGDQLTLTVWRQYKTLTLTVTVGEQKGK